MPRDEGLPTSYPAYFAGRNPAGESVGNFVPDGEGSAVLCAWDSLRHSVTAIAKEIRASCQRQIAHKPSFGLDIDWAFVDKYTIR